MASSSADLVATARAVANALDVPMPPRRIERYLARIEPTDGVLYPSVVAYHHRSVRLRAWLGSLPSMAVVGVDEGGKVDTVDFNAIPKPFTARDKREYVRLLDRLTRAVARRDLAEVGAGRDGQRRMNQTLRPSVHWRPSPVSAGRSAASAWSSATAARRSASSSTPRPPTARPNWPRRPRRARNWPAM